MSNNRTNQSLENRLVETVASLEREMLQLKTAQPIGADVLAVEGIPDASYIQAGPLTAAPGSGGVFQLTITPANETLTQWNFAYTIAVDGTSLVNDIYPFGGSMTNEKRKVRFSHSMDWATSSDSTNQRVFLVRLENFGTVSHDYYIFARFYIPKLAGTA